MSAHTVKKKRIGSRRHGAIQNKTYEADEFNRVDSATEGQYGIPEENESINVTIKNKPSTEMSQSRRKLGSSRKRKKEMYVKNVADESYHKNGEDVEEKNGACETPDTTQLSPAKQSHGEEKLRKCLEADPETLIPESENFLVDKNENIDADCEVVHSSCRTMEHMLEGSDKSDILEGEKLKEKYFVSASDLTSLNALPCHLVHKQLIGPSNATQIPEEEYDSAYFAIEKESKDGYKNPELLEQFENSQGNNLLSDSNLKKQLKEDTELEYNVEQEMSSTPIEKLFKQEQNTQINFPVRDVQHLEDALNKVREEEAKLQEMYADNHSSGIVTNKPTENEITFGDQPVVCDTYQSDFTLKRADDSATKHDCNSDKKLDLHPSDMNCSESSDHTNDCYINDTKKPQIGGRAETAPGQVYKTEGQVKDNLNFSFEKSINREQEGLLSEIEEGGSSLQTSPSQIQACLEFPPQQTDTTVSPLGNRRKLGSSRRNKGRQLVEDLVTESCRLTEAVVEDTRDNKQHETNLSRTETAAQENSMETTVKSNDVFDTAQTQDTDPIKGNAHASTRRFTTSSVHLTADQQLIDLSHPTEMPEEDLHNMCSETERESKEGNKDTQLLWLGGHLHNCLVSESHLNSGDVESSLTLDTPAEKHSLHAEVEYNPEQEGQSGIFSIPDIEVAPQLENDANNFQEQIIRPEQMNEMFQIDFSSMTDSTSSSQTLLSKTNVSLNYQPQDSCVREEEQTQTQMDRKIEHDQINNGLLMFLVKESVAELCDEHKEDITSGNKVLKTEQEAGAVQETHQGELNPESEHGRVTPITHDSSLHSAIIAGCSSEVQLPSTSTCPADLKISSYECENSLDDHHDGETDVTVQASNESAGDTPEGLDKSVSLQSQEVSDAHYAGDASQSVLKEGSKSPHEIHSFSKSMTCDAIEHNHKIISGDQIQVSDTYQHELLEKCACDNVSSQEVSNPDDVHPDVHISNKDSSEALDHTKDGYHEGKTQPISHIDGVVTAQDGGTESQLEGDFKLSAVQTFHEEKDEIVHDMEVSNSFIQNLQSEADLDFQCELNNTGFYPMRIVGNTGDDEPLETTKDTAELAKSMDTIPEEVTFTTARTEEVSNQIKEIANGGTPVGVCEYTTSSLDSSSREIVNELHEEAVKPAHTQEIHQNDLSSIKSRSSSLQTPQPEMKDESIQQPQENSVRTDEQTHTGFTPTRNRRKLGSSRRNKGRLHVKDSDTNTYSELKEEFVGNTSSDEAAETIKKSPAIKMAKPVLKNQASTDIKFAQEIKTTRSVLDDKENTQHNTEEGTIFSQIVMDSNGRVKTDITPRPGKDNKDINEEENDPINDPENLSQLTGYDKVKMDLMPPPEDDPDIQNILCHDCNVTATSKALDLLEQEDSNQVQKMEAATCGKDSLGQEIHEQQSNDAVETQRDFTNKDCNTEVRNSMDLLGQDEENLQDLSRRNNEAEVIENSDEKNGISEGHGCNSQQGIREKSNLHNTNILQGNYKERRRKMGSTRWSERSRKSDKGINKDPMEESMLNFQAETKAMDKIEALEELPMTVPAVGSENENAKASGNYLCREQGETNETSIFHNNGKKLLSGASVLQITESNMISDVDDSTLLLPGQPASHNEEVINPVSFVQLTDVEDSEKNVGAHMEPSQIDDFTGYDMHITTEITGRKSCLTRQSTQNEEEIMNLRQDQAFQSSESHVLAVTDLEAVKSEDGGSAGQEHNDAPDFIQQQNNVGKGLDNKYLEMKNTSPDLNLTSRRRKMGSTRRNLRSMNEGEHLHQKLDVDNEATDEHSAPGSEQRRAVFEMMDHSFMCESHLSPPSEQTVPSISLNLDVKSKTATGRRSRKLGSHRKLRGHRGDARSISDERFIKTTEAESWDLDKITEVEESDKKSLGDMRTSTAGEPVSQKTTAKVLPVQQSVELCLGQEREKTFSSVVSRPAAHTSKRYNVMMIGDSSVGKTSFMKRALSGKFSQDIPASVGLDSWMWTALIDEKPVMLQLWDTAGQERFHSITRQIFHKAQAFLLMYDITSAQSFSAVSYWANCIQEGAADSVTILLLGNKCDLAQRQVKTQDGETLAKEYSFTFMECSAATGENVIECLETVARMLIERADVNVETTVLHKEPQQRKSPGCC